ncbi:MAG TPA: hypothetical protein VK877_00260 [Pseudolabrys sp.]|nr:hypothetical protein [Pseudolabrys sp.]
MNLDGIKGESKDVEHKNPIDVESRATLQNKGPVLPPAGLLDDRGATLAPAASKSGRTSLKGTLKDTVAPTGAATPKLQVK